MGTQRTLGRRGPESLTYEIPPSMAYVVVVEVTRERTRVSIVNFVGTLIADMRCPPVTSRRRSRVVVDKTVRLATDAAVDIQRIRHAVVGVEMAETTCDVAALCESMRTRLACSVVLDSVANLAAVAERDALAAAGVRDFALMWIADEAKVAIIADGRLFRGPSGRVGWRDLLQVPAAAGSQVSACFVDEIATYAVTLARTLDLDRIVLAGTVPEGAVAALAQGLQDRIAAIGALDIPPVSVQTTPNPVLAGASCVGLAAVRELVLYDALNNPNTAVER
ncbi:hypothetical protein ABZS66_54235 [Dactylosporangium sp. NPDC005572]|uniref:hypothetical protein n=1 Tax=Dactylosporangium sp. NPDC005572 TaxID=3156889 RepID=UPI0033A6B85F